MTEIEAKNLTCFAFAILTEEEASQLSRLAEIGAGNSANIGRYKRWKHP
jgi:hypothetical protein